MRTKTLHEKLGISFAELGALAGVRGMLQGGVLVMDYDEMDDLKTTRRHLFNMNNPGEVNDHCGSIGCIGGTMAMILGLPSPGMYVPDAREKGRPISNLFYPDTNKYYGDWENITPDQAVEAIDMWLAGKIDDPWAGILDAYDE